MPLPTTNQVFEYVRKNPGISSKEIASHFTCKTTDINKSRENYIGIYENEKIKNKDYKHYAESEEELVVKLPTKIPSERKVQIKQIINKYLDVENGKQSALDSMYGDIYDLLDQWNPQPSPPHSLYLFVIFSFMLFTLSVYIDSEKMMNSIIQYQDGITNVTTGTYHYIFHLQSDFVESCQDLWWGQIFGNISIM